MPVDLLDWLALGAVYAVWHIVAWRVYRDERSDPAVFALVLIVIALLSTQFLAGLGISSPSRWAFLVAGVILLVAWHHKPRG